MPSTLENWITLAVHNTITEKDSLILICHQWRQWDTTQTNIPHYIHHLWSNFQLVNCLPWRQSKIDMYHHKRWIGNRWLFLFVVCLPPGEGGGLPPPSSFHSCSLSVQPLSLLYWVSYFQSNYEHQMSDERCHQEQRGRALNAETYISLPPLLIGQTHDTHLPINNAYSVQSHQVQKWSNLNVLDKI